MQSHLLGISGIGMSGLAKLLAARGERVSGCDRNADPLVAGAWEIRSGHHPDHLAGVDRLIVSSAIAESEPEVLAARAAGLPVLHRLEAVAELAGERPSLGITGSAGKTTTAAMAATILLRAGQDPCLLVGGRLAELAGDNARSGSGPLLLEVDESDPRCAALKLDLALFTNLEHDHIASQGGPNYYRSAGEQEQALEQLAQGSRVVLINGEDPALTRLFGSQALRFGFQGEQDYAGRELTLHPMASSFRFERAGCSLGEIEVPLPGRHNAMNALAALALTATWGVDPELARAALAGFPGTERRWQRLGSFQGALVLDDYAHNPAKVAAVLAAARQSGLRVRAIFQPHRVLRTATSWKQLAAALMAADEITLLDIYAAGEAEVPGVSSDLIAGELKRLGHPQVRRTGRPEQAAQLFGDARPGELLLTIGAGDVVRVGQLLLGGAAC